MTGASGFIGGRVARDLADAGHEVAGLVRDPARWNDRPDGAEVVQGDLTDVASVQRAVAGRDAVVHAAAMVKLWARDARQFDRVNVQGLSHVLQAARHQAARVIYLSSFIALGPTDGTVLDEDSPRVQETFYNDYERTKWLADQLARNIPPGSPELVRVYPGVVFGPGALTDGNHVVALLLQHARGKLPGLLGPGDRRQCFAYIDDVVQGVRRALETATDGSAYILGGENRTAVELFEAFRAAAGVAPPRRRIPYAVAGWVGKLQRWRAVLTGLEPELTDHVVGIYRHEWAYSSERAGRDLGYRITPFGEAVARTVAWLRERGELPGQTG